MLLPTAVHARLQRDDGMACYLCKLDVMPREHCVMLQLVHSSLARANTCVAKHTGVGISTVTVVSVHTQLLHRGRHVRA